ncbi:MAG: hypothetical protein WCK35_30225 [Chloroflexota bacterium]
MKNLLHQKNSKNTISNSLIARYSSLKGIFIWLSTLMSLTELERENAGVFLGGEGRV